MNEIININAKILLVNLEKCFLFNNCAHVMNVRYKKFIKIFILISYVCFIP